LASPNSGTARRNLDLALVDLELHRARPLVREQRDALDGAGQPIAIELDALVVALRNHALERRELPSIIREISSRPPTSKNRWFSPRSY
jgi:hypothetical protein